MAGERRGLDDEFVDRLTTSAYRIARARAVGYTVVDLEDVAQEVLARYLKSWGARGRPKNLDAWIETTTKNLLVDRARAAAARPTSPADQAVTQVLQSMESTSSEVIGHEVERDVYALISASDRDLLVERFGHGETAANLAERYGVSPAAIDQRVARAKKRLRDGLEANPALLNALKSDLSRVYSKHVARPH